MCQAVICLALVLCGFFLGGWQQTLLGYLKLAPFDFEDQQLFSEPLLHEKLFMPSLKPSLWSLFLPL